MRQSVLVLPVHPEWHTHGKSFRRGRSMTKENQELIYAGAAGALVALVYQLVKAHNAEGMATAFAPELIPILGVGALAGVAAMWLRRIT